MELEQLEPKRGERLTGNTGTDEALNRREIMPEYRGTIVGGIWMPPGPLCSLEVPRFEANDDQDAIDRLTNELAGDFSMVLDVEVWRIERTYKTADDQRIVKSTRTETLIKRFSEEAEIAYSDTQTDFEEDAV